MAVQSLKTILTTLTTFITNFVSNSNNPTGVTAAQIGAYTKTEIDALVSSKLGLGDTPISYWGRSMSDTPIVVADLTFLSFKSVVPALLGGARGVLQIQDLNVSLVNGVTTYVYLIASNGQLGYAGSATALPDDNVTMYLGKTVGNGASFTISDFGPVIRLGNARLSNTRKGGAIPISDNSGVVRW